MSKERILLFDLETSPNLGWTWGKWEQNVIQFKQEWKLLSFAFKWLGEPQIKSFSMKDHCERDVVKNLWSLLNEADVVIAHNGDQFDNKRSKAKFLEYDLPPPSPYKTIDTKKIAKSQFSFNSNSLNDLGIKLKLGKKIKHEGFDLWLGCMNGNEDSWNKMIAYNKQDVVLLELVYLKMLPWINNHPNVSLLREKKDGCPNCGSNHIQSRGHHYIASGSIKPKFQCRSCMKWFCGKPIKLLNKT